MATESRDFSCCDTITYCCVHSIRWIPCVALLLVVIWATYVYFFELLLGYGSSDRAIIVALIAGFFFLLLLVLFLWSAFQAALTPIAPIPNEYRVSADEFAELSRAASSAEARQVFARIAHDRRLVLHTRCPDGSVRYCDRCVLLKPDRTHHCSTCGTCVPRMDHHCPWVNNCVGYHNYKFFLLFLFYGVLLTAYIALTTLGSFVSLWQSSVNTFGELEVVLLCVFAFIFLFSLLCIFGFHVHLVLHSRTTLESFKSPVFASRFSSPERADSLIEPDSFDLGAQRSFLEIFGTDWRFWMLPTFTSQGNGFTYKTRLYPFGGCADSEAWIRSTSSTPGCEVNRSGEYVRLSAGLHSADVRIPIDDST